MFVLKKLTDESKKRGEKSSLRVISLMLSLLLISAGVYLLLLVRAPHVQPLTPAEQQEFVPEQYGERQLIIPKIAVNVEVNEGDKKVLDKGAWHRLPELGDPEKGGNFIVSAHRYVLAKTPQRTKEQSYFYNIDKLELGDEILVDWRGKRHTYKITKIYSAKPNQLEIESPSDDAKITLYTCTLGGSADGRVVIEAYPVS